MTSGCNFKKKKITLPWCIYPFLVPLIIKNNQIQLLNYENKKTDYQFYARSCIAVRVNLS